MLWKLKSIGIVRVFQYPTKTNFIASNGMRHPCVLSFVDDKFHSLIDVDMPTTNHTIYFPTKQITFVSFFFLRLAFVRQTFNGSFFEWCDWYPASYNIQSNYEFIQQPQKQICISYSAYKAITPSSLWNWPMAFAMNPVQFIVKQKWTKKIHENIGKLWCNIMLLTLLSDIVD